MVEGYPTDSERVGMRRVSLANIAVSDSRPFARLMSATATLYLIANPAKLSKRDTCRVSIFSFRGKLGICIAPGLMFLCTGK